MFAWWLEGGGGSEVCEEVVWRAKYSEECRYYRFMIFEIVAGECGKFVAEIQTWIGGGGMFCTIPSCAFQIIHIQSTVEKKPK